MRRQVALALVACLTLSAAAIAQACGNTEFTGDSDATTDGALGDAGASDAQDSASPADDGGITPCGNTPGASEIFAAPSSAPDQVATDDVYVYWASSTGPLIQRGLIAGAVPANVEPVIDRGSTVNALAVSNTYVCWILANADSTSGVLECGATSAIQDGGFTDAGYKAYSNQIGQLVGRATDFLYVRTVIDLLNPLKNDDHLAIADDPRLIASVSPSIVVVTNGEAGANGFFYEPDSVANVTLGAPFYVDSNVPSAIATDGTNIAVVYVTTQTVARLPFDGGPSVPIANDQPALGAVSIDHGNVYFIAGTGIMRVAMDGTCLTTIAPEATTGFVTADKYVYFASNGQILRARK